MKENAWLCAMGVTIALLLRCCITLHPYSGHAHPPMYGDYEAQRHWMEITLHLPATHWYRNTTDNDLLYWGLDYPPLTAYHSLLCGHVARLLNPAYVALHASRGFESPAHKLFMRHTVLLVDVLLFIPAVLLYFYWGRCEGGARLQPHHAVLLTLLHPALILIDHGHFQYNCVSLAFLIAAISLLQRHCHVMASVLFCLALNYKQMELYHSIPFFIYLLSMCVPRPGRPLTACLVHLYKLGAAVLVTFAVIWAPFLGTWEDMGHVLGRLFPVDRGIFEDKVANFWCCVNLVAKLRNVDQRRMLNYATVLTLAAVLPSATDLFLRPNVRKFLPALINAALAFFLFSYQVHEKSILLVAIPVLLYRPQEPFVCAWAAHIATFSMTPLLVKDGLMVGYVGLAVFYAGAGMWVRRMEVPRKAEHVQALRNCLVMILDGDGWRKMVEAALRNKRAVAVNFSRLLFYVSLLGCAVMSLMMAVGGNGGGTARYPDLYAVLVSVYCCVHFLGFFVYFNVHQLMIPELDRLKAD